MKKKNLGKIEVLAPGRNYARAKQAILCGADSIYIASSAFGLRYGFGNDISEIEKIVKFAHKYWARVYVTVNTLIFKEDDFEEVKNLIQKLYEIEVDAIIFQDMGILELDLPPIPLYASTTTSCFTPEKVKFLGDVGVQRAILPRELTLEQIRQIGENTDVPLESFVHGLLCVGYSGKCYLQYSKTIKNTKKELGLNHYQHYASSNGKCDMNCMHTYSLLDADGNIIVDKDRLLNMRFLDLSNHLGELVDAGVTSFKIEGRHKELSYVKNVVAIFRQKADEVIKEKKLSRLSSGRSILNFEPDLNKTFNKGYTNFFLYGRKKEMYSKNEIAGVEVGKIDAIKDDSFKLDSDVLLNKGDKLRFLDENGTVRSIDILKARKGFNFPDTLDCLKEGMTLYRYLNARAIREIESAKVYRVLSVDAQLIKEAGKVTLSGTDEDGNFASASIMESQKGLSCLSEKELSDFLKEFSTAEFLIDNLNISGNPSISKELLKQIKSKFFSKLRKQRKINRPRAVGSILKNSIPYPDKKLSYLDNVVNKKAVEFFERHGVKEIEPGMESNVELEGKQVLTGKYCIKNELDLCTKRNIIHKVKEPLFLMDSHGNKYELKFDCSKCEMKAIF